MKMRNTILLFALSLVSLVSFAHGNVKHVILITIDGMREDMITDFSSPTENLKEMKRSGLWVNWIKGVAPAETYPSHTTIITGRRPCDHHIYYNAPFMGNEPKTISNWYADSIHGETLWQAVSAKAVRSLLCSGQCQQELKEWTIMCLNFGHLT